MSKGIVILLCNLTTNAALPWADAGHHVYMVDPQHPAGIHTYPDHCFITRIGGTIIDCAERLGRIMRGAHVAFVMGFPPCTDVAVSGARWFNEKRAADPHFQSKAAIVAEQCRMIGMLSGAPWAFENPVSIFSSIFGKPQHTFSPEDYTGYCADDNYTKKTCLWTGGGFVMPEPFRDTALGAPDDRIHKAPPSEGRANFRSATPKGFSRALFEANKPRQLEIAA